METTGYMTMVYLPAVAERVGVLFVCEVKIKSLIARLSTFFDINEELLHN